MATPRESDATARRAAREAALLELGDGFLQIQEMPRQVLFGPARPSAWGPVLCALTVVVPFVLTAILIEGAGGDARRSSLWLLIGVSLAVWLAAWALSVPLLTATALWRARRGHVSEGLRLLNALTRACGTPRPFIVPRAQLLLGCHFAEEGAEYLQSMWSRLPRYLLPTAKSALGTALVLLERDLPEAEAMLREALAARPAWRELRLPLGIVLYLQNRYAEALKELEAGAPLIEKLSRMRKEPVYFALGECHVAAGDRKQAAHWFKKSREEIDARHRESGVGGATRSAAPS